MNNVIIHAGNVSKSYGDISALNDITLDVQSGSIIGLIGPDGAGKSSLMKIILTLEKADRGDIEVLGKSITEDRNFIRHNIGYMPEVFSLYLDLSVEENLKFYFKIYKLDTSDYHAKLERLYKFNRLEPFKKHLARELSGGMKQKLALSCALMHEPKLLILDEPTTGVDPLSRKEFWHMLRDLKKDGITILVSTPYMDEAFLCDQIYLMHQGNILEQGAPDTIISQFEGALYDIPHSDPYHVIDSLKDSFPEEIIYMVGKNIHIVSQQVPGKEKLNRISSIAGEEYPVKKITPTLEDIFLNRILALEKIHE